MVINAFAHRSYLNHEAPVFIAVYDNRVEITSPGGLPRGQTAERAVTGFSKIRNEALAKALNYMRLMEEWGSGLKRVNDVLGEYGLQKVTIEDVGFAVRMNAYRNNALDSEVVKFGKSAEKHAGDGVNEGVNEGVSNVYEEIRRNPGIRTPSLVKAVGGSQASIERAIAKLKRLQKIVYRGAPKTGGYYCI